MKSKVFVSCGQRPSELEVARQVGKLLERRGFNVYIAVDVQTILEINTGIIRELKNSDCYLFINFCREKIAKKKGAKYRGSLFSNQELAIAYALGFERILVINQRDIVPEGLLRYIGNNTETFSNFDDCCDTVERALDRSKWTADYSRRLRAGEPRFSDGIQYGTISGTFLYLDIFNDRPDIAALETTAKCSEFARIGESLRPCPIRSPLKATGRPGFSHSIFPKSHEAFDLLCIGTHNTPVNVGAFGVPPLSGSIAGAKIMHEEAGVFLNTALDRVGPQSLPITPGTWVLRYEFFAIDFPVLSVLVELILRDHSEPRASVMRQDVI